MKERRPTVLPSAAPAPSAPPAPAPRLPTRIPSAAGVPAAARVAGGPTQLQGVRRQGLDVSLEAVRARFAALSPAEAESVQQVLQATMPQLLSAREAAAWGQAPQQRYGELVEQALQLAQDPQRLAAGQHVQRLHVLLAEVAEAIEEQLQPGLLTRWRTGPCQLLAGHRDEIEQLRRALGAASDALETQLVALAAIRREMRTVAAAMQAHGLAASWLAADPLVTDAAVRETLLRRAAELAAAQAHIAGAQALREQAETDLRELSACIRQAVLLLLPAWLEKAMHAGRGTPHPTAARELQQGLAGLLHELRAR